MNLIDFVRIPGKLDALRHGVTVMKGRKPSDPTSWFFQGAIHAVSQEARAAAIARDPAVATVDHARFWNKCPHFGASSADFVIWHSAYINYFERILRAASGDPTLSLPYWNYVDPAQRKFPREFANPEIAFPGGPPRNPLYDHRREQAFMNEIYELSEPAVATKAAMDADIFFGADESSGFAGGVGDTNPRTRGLIERSPHDMLHYAIGGAVGFGEPNQPPVSGLMASVRTAAFDPIFWIHHANIDRLWSVWDVSPDRKWGNVPDDVWLDEAPWSFHDEQLVIHERPRTYYIKRSNLGVRYDTDTAGAAALSESDPKRARPRIELGEELVATADRRFSFDVVSRFPLGAALGESRVGPDTEAMRSIQIEQRGFARDVSLATEALRSARRDPLRIILELEDVRIEGVTSVGFDVFINLADGQTPDRELPNYVGTLSLFGADMGGGHGDHGGSQVERFDITESIVALGGSTETVDVRIVPFDLLVPVSGEARVRREEGVTIGAMRVNLAVAQRERFVAVQRERLEMNN